MPRSQADARARRAARRRSRTTSRTSRCGRRRSRRRARGRRSRTRSRRRPTSLLPPQPNDAGKDLQVLRYMPEGDVPLAPELSVTFNQPMVAVTSQDDAAKTKPVKLDAGAEGQVALDRHAHDPVRSRGSLPAGDDVQGRDSRRHEERATAAALEEGGQRSRSRRRRRSSIEHYPGRLSAAAPRRADVRRCSIRRSTPQGRSRRSRSMPAAPTQVERSVGQGAAPMHTVAIRMLDDKEIAKDKRSRTSSRWRRRTSTTVAGSRSAPSQPLPADAQITVEIPAGTPSAEGPNKTKDAQTFTFHTYPPLRVSDGLRLQQRRVRRACR